MSKRENRKIEMFGLRVKGWNKKINGITIVSIVVLLFLTLLYSVFQNVNQIFTTRLPFLILEISTLFWLVGICVMWHVMSYVMVEGRDGATMQGVKTCVTYMPFSMETYFRWLAGRVKQTFCGISFACFVIYFVGCFFDLESAEITNTVSFVFKGVEGKTQILSYLLIAFGKTVFLVVCMYAWFYFFKKLLICSVEQNRTGKKVTKMHKQSKDKWKKRLGIVLLIVVLLAVLRTALLIMKDVLAVEDVIMGLVFFGIAIIGWTVYLWYFVIPVLGLAVVHLIPFSNKEMVHKVKKFLWIFLLGAVLLRGVPMMIDLCYQIYYGWESVYVITSSITTVVVPIGLLLFEIFLDFTQQKEKQKAIKNAESEELTMESRRQPWSFEKKISVALIIGAIGSLGIVISACCYERFTLDGVKQHRLAGVKTYTWEDVEVCMLEANWNGTLVMKLRMGDGTEISYKETGINYLSRDFEDQWYLYDERYQSSTQDKLYNMYARDDYFDAMETYYLWVAMELSERNVPFQADWEKLEQDLSDSHDAVVSGIREVATGEVVTK